MGVIDIESVKPLNQFFLELKFGNGETRYLDFNVYLKQGGPITALRKKSLFEKVFVLEDGDGVGWPNGIELACYDLGKDNGSG